MDVHHGRIMRADLLPAEPFTTATARSLGMTRKDLDALVSMGMLRRLLHGVYQRRDQPDTIESRISAARLVVTAGAVFVDRTAAWLHGVDIFDYRELEFPPPVECVVLRGRSRIERKECSGGERDLAARDVMPLRGVQVTTPLRTALDLGCKLSRPDGLAALDLFGRHHGVTEADLLRTLPRYRGRRGVVKLRGLVLLADPRSESAGESRVRLRIHDDGLPMPVPQHWVLDHGVPRYRLDLAYPKHRIAVEYDGEWHDATADQRRADQQRRTWLREHGWKVIVVRRGELGGRSSEPWLRDLRNALQLAG